MYKLYMRCKNYICVEIEVKCYIYIYTPLVHKPWTIFIGCDWCENWLIANGWLELFVVDIDWLWLKNTHLWLRNIWLKPHRISLWKWKKIYMPPTCELDAWNPHCQKLRGFKVERGAVLGTVSVLTTMPLCYRNVE